MQLLYSKHGTMVLVVVEAPAVCGSLVIFDLLDGKCTDAQHRSVASFPKGLNNDNPGMWCHSFGPSLRRLGLWSASIPYRDLAPKQGLLLLKGELWDSC